mmetsp:Transcript_187/g.473  ORF Transcript_187/g.473 Transcript_187/m.473 type:complete len:242 (+) Transcript_187:842-1567(+)
MGRRAGIRRDADGCGWAATAEPHANVGTSRRANGSTDGHAKLCAIGSAGTACNRPNACTERIALSTSIASTAAGWRHAPSHDVADETANRVAHPVASSRWKHTRTDARAERSAVCSATVAAAAAAADGRHGSWRRGAACARLRAGPGAGHILACTPPPAPPPRLAALGYGQRRRCATRSRGAGTRCRHTGGAYGHQHHVRSRAIVRRRGAMRARRPTRKSTYDSIHRAQRGCGRGRSVVGA